MYRLRCPHCGAAQDHAFVRPGAVTVCGRCHTIWRVQHDHVQRVAAANLPAEKPGPAVGTETAVPPPPPRKRSPGDSAAGASADDTSIVGLSGLSDVMRGPGDPGPDDADAQATPLAAGRPAPADPPSPRQFRQQQAQSVAQRRALDAAAKRRRRTTLVLLATLTVMVGSLGVAVALLAAKPANAPDADSDNPPDTPELTAPHAASQVDPAAVGDTLVVEAIPLDLRDPRLLAAARPGIRAVVELLPVDAPDRLQPDQLALRLNATALADETLPGPIPLLLTASDAGRLTAAWQLTDPRDLPPLRPHRLIAQLDAFPESADPQGWIVTALEPTSP